MNVKNEKELRNVDYNYNKYSNVCQVYYRRREWRILAKSHRRQFSIEKVNEG